MEKQVLIIPTDGRKPKNMGWKSAMEYFNVSNERLIEIVEKGEEINGFFVDEALIYDSKLM